MLGHDERSQPRRPRPALVRLDDLLGDLVGDRLAERSAVGEVPIQCGCRHPNSLASLRIESGAWPERSSAAVIVAPKQSTMTLMI